jgi:hypothetical protein
MDINEPVAYINVEERKLEWAKPTTWHTPTIAQMEKIPLYTHPHSDKSVKAKTLTDEDIAKVVHELNQKANTPERWVTAMQIGAETIIQLRNELRKAQEK